MVIRMNDIKLYIILKKNKYKLSKQQYSTIKGQIKKGDLDGAYKGLKNCLNIN